jgi:hypothetical protein
MWGKNGVYPQPALPLMARRNAQAPLSCVAKKWHSEGKKDHFQLMVILASGGFGWGQGVAGQIST